MIAQSFIPTAEPVMHTGTQTNEANVKIRTQPVIVEAKIRNCCLIYLLDLFILNHVLFHLKDNFLFHLFFKLNSRSDMFVFTYLLI